MDRSEVVSFLAEQWRASGVSKGDLLLVHSSASRTLKKIKKINAECGPSDIVDSFVEAVGSEGTVLFPTFNFDFNEGVEFDIRNTKSHMGVVTEAARKHPEAIRTGHPVYSFAVIGKDAFLFKGMENYSGYGDDSPFAFIHNQGGKIAVLDLPDQNSMTFYHYVEESLKVGYRYFKEFSASYKGRDGKARIRSFAIFVRDVEKGVRTHVNPMGEILWEKGVYSGSRPKEGSGLRVAAAKNIYDEVSFVIKSGMSEGLLFKFEG